MLLRTMHLTEECIPLSEKDVSSTPVITYVRQVSYTRVVNVNLGTHGKVSQQHAAKCTAYNMHTTAVHTCSVQCVLHVLNLRNLKIS